MPLFFNMADLSAYIDFSVKVDFNTKKIVIDSVALDGLPVGITEVSVSAKIRQPDCATGSLTPVVETIYPLVFSEEKTLRLTSEGNPQKGTYKVTLTVQVDGYDDTIIEKEFVLRYEKPVVSLSKNFNILTPALKFVDDTVYNVSGLSISSTTRAWVIQVGAVGELNVGDLSEADLKYSGSYYDAKYEGELTTSLVYLSDDYAFLTVVDEVTGSIEATANTIPPYADFAELLTYIKENSGADGDCCDTDCETADYKKAFTLFKDIALHICETVSASLLSNINKFLAIYYKYAGAYVNTDTALAAYDLSFCTTQIGENSYIKNTTVQQENANINIDGTITAAGTAHAEGTVERFVIIQDGTLKYLTASEMVAAFGGTTPGAHLHTIGQVTGLQTALNSKVVANAAITGATKTKITYDAKGLVTAGEDLVESDIPTLPQSKITDLTDDLAGKAAVGHSHAIDDVANLQSTLDDKAEDDEVVHLTGAETIAGVKVFESSPIVPTPTNNAHAVTKAYVDALVVSATGLNPTKITLNTDGTFEIPAGSRFFGMVITPTGEVTMKAGLTPGGDEIMPETTIAAAEDKDINIAVICRTAKTLYFTGITATTDILIYIMTLTPINP